MATCLPSAGHVPPPPKKRERETVYRVSHITAVVSVVLTLLDVSKLKVSSSMQLSGYAVR